MKKSIVQKSLKREKQMLFKTFSKKKTLELIETNIGYPYNTDKIKTIDTFKISNKIETEYINCCSIIIQTIGALIATFITFLGAFLLFCAGSVFVVTKLIILPFYLIYFYFKVENLRNDPKFKELKKRHFDCIERFGKNEVCKCK